MRRLLRRASLAFTAGVAGGLAASLFLWACGRLGLTAALGVRMAPALTAGWLSRRLVRGGLWGMLFLLPVLVRRALLLRGLVLSAGPAAAQLVVHLPLVLKKGFLGLGLGTLTPLFVVAANLCWGLAAAAWLAYAGADDAGRR